MRTSLLFSALLPRLASSLSSKSLARGLGSTPAMAASESTKLLTIVRHGQAEHNPRAEVARKNGCSFEEFIQLMREDDVLDAPLTAFGRQQADDAKLPESLGASLDLVVSSSLSRAMETADRVASPNSPLTANVPRVCNEAFREVNGDMLNAKRQSRSSIRESFQHWNLDDIDGEEDNLWTPTMEKLEDAADRGYQGLCWLLERPEKNMLLVSHGGLLKYVMTTHPLVRLQDDRAVSKGKAVDDRFDNCERRQYRMQWDENDASDEEARRIVLIQVDETS